MFLEIAVYSIFDALALDLDYETERYWVKYAHKCWSAKEKRCYSGDAFSFKFQIRQYWLVRDFTRSQIYSQFLITRTFWGNREKFELSGVRSQ